MVLTNTHYLNYIYIKFPVSSLKLDKLILNYIWNKPKIVKALLKEEWGRRPDLARPQELLQGFPGGTLNKNPPVKAGGMGSTPGSGRFHMLQSI